MSSLSISALSFGLIFGGALLGMYLRTILPEHHLNPDSKDIVKLGMGLVGTMCALVLGLLVASAKNSYDAQGSDLTQMSARIILLDRVLAHYGPETGDARTILRDDVKHVMDRLWPQDGSQHLEMDPTVGQSQGLYDKIEALSPKDERQRLLQSQALNIATELGRARWLMFEQATASISKPLVAVVIFWLAAIFVSWGLFAPTNGTVVVTLCIAALSVSAAILLVLELYTPYEGLIRLSSAPMREALAHLGL